MCASGADLASPAPQARRRVTTLDALAGMLTRAGRCYPENGCQSDERTSADRQSAKRNHMRALTLLVLAAVTPALAQPTDGLVGFWPLNSDFLDASGNGLHGIGNIGGAVPIENRQGSEGCAYRIIEGGFDVPQSSLLEVLPTGGITMSYWTHQSQGDSFGRMMLQPASPSLAIILETWYAGLPSFGQLGSQFAADSAQITFDGQWHLITGVYDQGDWYLYYDANLLQLDTSGTVLAYPGAATLSVGGAWNTDFDDVRIYDRALSQLEVGYLYEEQPDCSIAASVEQQTVASASVGPNPTHGPLNIRFTEPVAKGSIIDLFDHTGRLILQQTISGMSPSLDLSTFARGIYEVRITSGTAQQAIRVVKE